MSERKSTFEQFEVAGDKLVETIKNLFHEGNVQRVILKREDGSTLLEIPVNAGIVGVALTAAIAPLLLAIGAIAAVVTKMTLVVERSADESADDPASNQADSSAADHSQGSAERSADQDPAASI
ncbi:DUF4342 domain-containing protein [Agreia sp. COWG]|uniref:DUF4342 domain-containing protein n=1 Tax=Agreia sp. COWG TaxID=2773266 RepID=UPI001927A6FB|nr:DUF4342 domain-containing protein [Agreia sp. COWG]